MDSSQQRKFSKFVNKHFTDVEEFSRGTGAEIRMLCPFCHGGASGEVSFDINIDKGVTRCWRGSCGYSGSAAWFLKDYLSISYPEALEILEGDGDESLSDLQADLAAASRSLELKYDSTNSVLLGETIEEMIQGAEILEETSLKDDAFNWLEGRGYNPEDFIAKHPLYAVEYQGRYSGRVLFEVTTLDHVAFLAYSISPSIKPKTLNPKGETLSRMLYNYNSAADGEVIFVCEGVFDVARLTSWGLDAVAIFGINLSVEQVYLLSKTSAKEICVMLDHGTVAKSVEAVELLAQFILNKDITMITIEKDGADPDDTTIEELEELFSKRKKWSGTEMDIIQRQSSYLTEKFSKL